MVAGRHFEVVVAGLVLGRCLMILVKGLCGVGWWGWERERWVGHWGVNVGWSMEGREGVGPGTVEVDELVGIDGLIRGGERAVRADETSRDTC